MATLYVTEYASPEYDSGLVQIAEEPETTTQTVAISGSSAATTNAFHNNTNIVRLHTDSICSVVFGVSPTAATTNRRMNAGDTEYFGVGLGTGLKVAAITNT